MIGSGFLFVAFIWFLIRRVSRLYQKRRLFGKKKSLDLYVRGCSSFSAVLRVGELALRFYGLMMSFWLHRIRNIKVILPHQSLCFYVPGSVGSYVNGDSPRQR